MSRKLPVAAHTGQPWRIHEIAPDFRVEDVWAFRTPGAGPHDFPVVLAALWAAGGPKKAPWPVRALFAARWKLGALLGWDRPSTCIGARVASLRDRMPQDLRDAPRGPDSADMPLKAVYELDAESARELANKTVHTIMHLGWVPADNGEHELRMAVLVKPNGTFGRALHGSHRALPSPGRLPGADPPMGARLARPEPRGQPRRDRAAPRRERREPNDQMSRSAHHVDAPLGLDELVHIADLLGRWSGPGEQGAPPRARTSRHGTHEDRGVVSRRWRSAVERVGVGGSVSRGVRGRLRR
ncbi:hypothetical protein GCM10020000_14150 [Streptomyces olivoverticillatus]